MAARRGAQRLIFMRKLSPGRLRLRVALLPVLLAPALLAGCIMQRPDTGANAPGSAGLSPVAFTALPGWSPETAETGLASFMRSCASISVMPEDQTLGGDGIAASLAGKAGQWRGVCAAARAVPPGDAAAAQTFFQTDFVPYEAATATRVTGYFEPVYAGSELRLRGYDIPLYGKPDNLLRTSFSDAAGHDYSVGRLNNGQMVPYYTRAQIERGAIAGNAKPVAWLRDPVDAYMVQVQGSARLRLPDGTMIDLGFDGTNGRAYTPIGKLMVQKGYLPANDLSIQTISAWLRAHPAEAATLLDGNENYVFMKRLLNVPDGLGAPGALGVPLTPEGSIAVDEKAIPLGAPVFVATKTMDRLTVAQDIDVSARGASAAQVFFGIGRNAATLAGSTDEAGRMFVLLPRPGVPAPAASASGATS